MSTTRAVVQTEFGGPEVLHYGQVEVSEPGPNEVRIRQSAIGVNFHDTYIRSGLYQFAPPPLIPGVEGVGEIVAVGSSVTEWELGERVAYVDSGYGAYAEQRNVAADLLISPPSNLSDAVVVSSLVRGLTVSMLLRNVYELRAGDLCLIHAAGGSTGTLLAESAADLGARVIVTTGSRERTLHLEGIVEQVYSYKEEDWAAQLLGDFGENVHYVCDSIGAATFAGSLAVAKKCGHVALFGQSSGDVGSIPVSALAKKSLTITRPVVFDYIREAASRQVMMDQFYSAVSRGAVHLLEPEIMSLEQAGEAQLLLESGGASRPLVLRPGA